jgi:hypothetical protein
LCCLGVYEEVEVAVMFYFFRVFEGVRDWVETWGEELRVFCGIDGKLPSIAASREASDADDIADTQRSGEFVEIFFCAADEGMARDALQLAAVLDDVVEDEFRREVAVRADSASITNCYSARV